jgi:predicted DNA-binding transcriptional regulator YafY
MLKVKSLENNNAKERLLEIFFKAVKGDSISVKELALNYDVSNRTISRDLKNIKNFLADQRDLVGNAEFDKSPYKDNSQVLHLDFLLSNKELFAITKIILGSRSLSRMDVLEIISKLKRLTSTFDRKMLDDIVRKELYHYKEVKHDSKSVIDNLWQIVNAIDQKNEITIEYYKMDRKSVARRIKPIAILFSEYYFYLIAFHVEDDSFQPIYYRVDRIVNIIKHKKKFAIEYSYKIDEGEIKNKVQFMFPGKCQKVRFEFSGPSVQAILDRLPTAKIIETYGKTYLIEAEVFGDGIKMYLLSQGSWVKVLSPPKLVNEISEEVRKMSERYA